MKAGLFRHKIIIQKFTELQASDGSGDRIKEWVDYKFVSAQIKDLSVRDFIAARRDDGSVNTRIAIRYREGIDETCRIYHPATRLYYRVLGVMRDSKTGNEFLTLICERGSLVWETAP